MEVFVARQPIFDNQYNVVAYELLYRDSLTNSYKGGMADNVATSLLIANTFLTFGINNLIGDKRAFINFDQYLIIERIPELLNPDDVAIEILETVEPNSRFMDEIVRLKSLGYTVAIDDYYMDYSYKNLADIVDLIKIDFFQNSKEDIEHLVKGFKKQGKLLLAEKVETKEDYEWAKSIGFNYFQGYFFARPKIQTRKSIDNNALQYVKLMGELNQAEPDFKSLASILKLDVALTYKLLKLVNTIAKPVEKISSLQHGIAVLGVKKFRRWLSLAIVQNLSTRETYELTKFSLFRTHFLSLIAQHSDMNTHEDELSLLGTLSILDVILEMDMKDVLSNLPLHIEMAKTLLGESSKYSNAYIICMAYEKGEFELAEAHALLINYPVSDLYQDYVESVKCSEETFVLLNQFK